MGEMVPPHPVFGFEMADTGLDGGAPSQVSLDRLRDGPFLAADIDLELVVRRRIVAAVATVRNDARKIGADLGFPSPARCRAGTAECCSKSSKVRL